MTLQQVPGDLIHLDTKKLGRFHGAGHRVTNNRRHRRQGAGWEYVHVCVDDHSCVALSRIYPDETTSSATAFLAEALDYFQHLGVTVRRVLTDNGGCYRSRAFNHLCAYAHAYDNSQQRARVLPPRLRRYNWQRPPYQSQSPDPLSRLGLKGDNVLRLHS